MPPSPTPDAITIAPGDSIDGIVSTLAVLRFADFGITQFRPALDNHSLPLRHTHARSYRMRSTSELDLRSAMPTARTG
jgi:hypothetical protein